MKLTHIEYEKCKEIFTALGEYGLSLSHYQLANETEIHDAILWKTFLMDPRTVDYIDSEMNIIRKAAINQMVQNAPTSNSVGQSQLINAITKLDEKSHKKEGPAFIYSYVPLNDEQKYASNIRRVDTDGIELNEDGTWTMEI